MLIEIAICLVPVVFAILFGMFDGAQTIRKDAPEESIFWKHAPEKWGEFYSGSRLDSYRTKVRRGETEYSEFDLWFAGGNKWYPPHAIFNPFKVPRKEGEGADFWHQMKGNWTFMISLAAMSAAAGATVVGLWMLIPCFFLYGVEGLTFVFFYKYVFRKKEFRAKNVLEYIKLHVLTKPDYKKRF